jgi:hypothetical protein
MNQQQEEERAQESQESDISAPQSSQMKSNRGETRRVQLTGGSTLVVSLPSDWAKGVGLKAKDEAVRILDTGPPMGKRSTSKRGPPKFRENRQKAPIIIGQN